jgi:hypothetical protein
MKVVINRCFGGFGLSDAGLEEYKGRRDITDPNFYYYDIPRDCPVLVSMVEEQGTAINGGFADLKVVEIPDGISWFIDEYDGMEHVAERHRTWN